jgi:hypothetical protein
MTAPKPNRRTVLRILALVLICFAGIDVLLLAVQIRQAVKRHETAYAIESWGGRVVWDSKPWEPFWARDLLGPEFFHDIVGVRFSDGQVTDAGLANLAGLSRLEFLWLDGPQVTDAGLEHLQRLGQLQGMWLENAHITDVGLDCLQGLGQLRHLVLAKTQVTDNGVQKLKKALSKCIITRLRHFP